MIVPRRAYAWMLCSAFSFSIMATAAHALAGRFDWRVIAVVRTVIALALTVTWAWSSGARLVLFRPGTLWIRSLAGSVALLANFYCLTHYPAAETLAVTNLFPLWIAILSWPVLGLNPGLHVWPCAATAIAGVFLMLRPQFHYGPLPIAIAVMSSFASAIAMMGLHRLKNVDPRAVVAHFSGVSLLCSAAACLTWPSEASAVSSTTADRLLLLLVGVSATSGQWFLTKAFAAGPPAQIAVVNLTQVGLTLLMEWSVLEREVDALSLAGIALVVAPTAWVMTHRR